MVGDKHHVDEPIRNLRRLIDPVWRSVLPDNRLCNARDAAIAADPVHQPGKMRHPGAMVTKTRIRAAAYGIN
ncbi:hypothetical protein ASF00_08235 [Sphingomonas sp. Leaf34]|nr:hypothetical protein ASE72_18330 [Sphingomonas sp. Leaf20]KQN30675.1 hypothetical protein ASF00_08235 [Sphingomonas sp. Leaf34]